MVCSLVKILFIVFYHFISVVCCSNKNQRQKHARQSLLGLMRKGKGLLGFDSLKIAHIEMNKTNRTKNSFRKFVACFSLEHCFFIIKKYLNEEGQINDHILCISKHHLTKITSNTVAVEINVHFKIGIRSSALRAFRREERDVHCSKQKYLSFLIKQE